MAVKKDYPEPHKLILKKGVERDTPYYIRNEEKTYHLGDQEIFHRQKKRNKISIILILNVLLLIAGVIIIQFLVDTDTAYKEYEGYIFVLQIVSTDSDKKIQLKIINKNPESTLSGSNCRVRFFIPEKTDKDVHNFLLISDKNNNILINSLIPVYAGDKVVSAEITGSTFSFILIKKK